MMIPASLLLAAAPLTLQLGTPQSSVLTGEPVKIVLAWSATQPVKDRLTDPCFLEIVVEGGSSARTFRPPCDLGEAVAPDELRRGETLTTELVLVRVPDDAGDLALLFSAEGRYVLRARYRRADQRSAIESNTVAFDVSAPTGDDLEIYAHLKREAGFLLTPAAESLIGRFPHSRYLRLPALRLVQRRMDDLLSRRDPDSKEMLWHLDRPQHQELCRHRFREMANDLLSTSGDWGAFESDRPGSSSQSGVWQLAQPILPNAARPRRAASETIRSAGRGWLS